MHSEGNLKQIQQHLRINLNASLGKVERQHFLDSNSAHRAVLDSSGTRVAHADMSTGDQVGLDCFLHANAALVGQHQRHPGVGFLLNCDWK